MAAQAVVVPHNLLGMAHDFGLAYCGVYLRAGYRNPYLDTLGHRDRARPPWVDRSKFTYKNLRLLCNAL
jgi:hypothetical protein